MLNGNTNQSQRFYEPLDWRQSRFMPGRQNPFGFGIERLMGGVPQPVKQNSLPGFGTMAPDPTMQGWMRMQRTAGLPSGMTARQRMLF